MMIKLRRQGCAFRPVGEIRQLDMDGLPVECWLAGAGPRTVAFIHGNSAAKEVFVKQLSTLAGGDYSLIAIDLPGHGGSDDAANPHVTYTIPSYALLIKRVLDRLGAANPVIVGWSLGGHIALEMAGRGFPLAGLLICGTPPMGPGMEDFAAAFLPSASTPVATKQAASGDEIRSYTKDLYGSLDPIPDYYFKLADRTDGRARSRMGEHWASGEEGCNQHTVAAGWAGPICVVHGMADTFISYDYLKSVVWRNLWSDRIFEFAKSGHAPFLEEPARFNDVLGKFLLDVFPR